MLNSFLVPNSINKVKGKLVTFYTDTLASDENVSFVQIGIEADSANSSGKEVTKKDGTEVVYYSVQMALWQRKIYPQIKGLESTSDQIIDTDSASKNSTIYTFKSPPLVELTLQFKGPYDVKDFVILSQQQTEENVASSSNAEANIAATWAYPDFNLPFTPVPVPMPIKDVTRIGYAVFDCPIHYITQSRTTQVEQLATMRLPGTIKKGTGKAYETYTISYVAQGPLEIQSAVQEVFEQISLTPFLSVEGGPFINKETGEGDIPHSVIAVRNFSVTTIDGYPNALQVEISFDPFNWQYYIPMSDNPDHPIFTYDDCICWPLFKVWAKRAEKSVYKGTSFNGTFNLSFPSSEGAELVDLIYSNSDNLDVGVDHNALQSFITLLNTQQGGAPDVRSRNVKEIINPGTKYRVFVLKLDTKLAWDSLIRHPQVVGITTWNKLSAANSVDHLGNFLPESALIVPSYFSEQVDSSFKFTDGTSEEGKLTRYIDIPINDSLDQNIYDYLVSQLEYGDLAAVQASKNPQDIFAIVFKTESNDESLKTVLKDLKSKIDSQDDVLYKSRNTQIDEIFSMNSITDANGKLLPPLKSGGTILNKFLEKEIIDTSLPAIEIGRGGVDKDIIIERIGGSRGHNLAILSPRHDPLPIHQYMGGMDATFIVQGKCFGLDAKKTLEELKEEFDTRAITKKSKKYSLDVGKAKSGDKKNYLFLHIQNEIFSLLGVNFVMPVTLQFTSLDQQPDVWEFTLTLIEFHPDMKAAEEVKFLPTSWDKLGKIHDYGWDPSLDIENPIIDKAVEYFNLQAQLAKEEVYPDLQLPTLGELKFFIKAIYKGAESYLNKLNLLKSDKAKSNVTTELTATESYIASFVESQFFPTYAQKIKDEWKPDVKSEPGSEPSHFAEPDFYVYYTPEEGFRTIMDQLMEHQLGKGPQKSFSDKKNTLAPNSGLNTLSAPGRLAQDPTGKKLPTSVYREHDAPTGTTTIYPSEYLAGSTINNPLGPMLDKVYQDSIFPTERANNYKSLLSEATKRLDEPGSNAWWLHYQNENFASSNYVPGSKILALSEIQEDTMVNSELPVGDERSANLEPGKAGERADYTLAYSNTGKYFDIGWRQSMVKKYCINNDLTVNNVNSYFTENKVRIGASTPKFFAVNPNDLLPAQARAVIEEKTGEVKYDPLEQLGKKIGGYNVEEVNPDLSLEKIENAIKVLALEPRTDFSQASGRVKSALQDIEPLRFENTIPWTSRVSLINQKERRNISTYDAAADVEKKVRDSKSLEGVKHAWKYGITFTAQVFLAAFIARNGLNLENPVASEDDSYFDFNKYLLGKNTPNINGYVNKSGQIMIFVHESYKSTIGGFHTPSLVLLYMNLLLTSSCAKYRDSEGKLLDYVVEDIKKANNKLRSDKFKFSRQGIQTIQNTLSTYPEAGNVVDMYYHAYILFCRIFGAAYKVPEEMLDYDPFFNPNNLLNFIDTETNEEVVTTKFIPSGRRSAIGISLDRSNPSIMSTSSVKRQFQDNYNKNMSSIDVEAANNSKMAGVITPHTESAMYGHLVDFRQNAPIGKLRSAFPSFQILLINEGFYWNGGNQKLWDQFYTRTAVASIEVHRSRHKPGAAASVTFSNMFHNLTNYSLLEAMLHKSAVANHELLGRKIKSLGFFNMIGEIWNMLVVKNVPEDARKIWQNNQLKKLALTAGTRLQIRMGYGSNAARLPVVFIGSVLDVPVSDGYVSLNAVSDGHQLEKPCSTSLVNVDSGYAFQDGGVFGLGSDPSLIVKHSLIAATWWDNITGGNYRDHSSGVANFGEVIFSGTLRYSSEVEFNMYSARRTRMESGIGEIARYQFFNGLVNWENERNLFSVSVKEPTPWKVMEVCRRACSDFVAAAEPFAMRSTVFFGKWWWPYHYAYDPRILSLRNSAYEASARSFNATSPVKSESEESGSKIYGAQNIPPAVIEEAKKHSEDKYTDEVIGAFKLGIRNIGQLFWFFNAKRQVFYRVYYASGRVREFSYDLDDNGKVAFEEETEKLDTGWIGKRENMLADLKERQQKMDSRYDKSETFIYEGKQSTAALRVDALKQVSFLQEYLLWKPYCQAYIAHSAINLLDVSIRADGSKVVTDAIGLHLYNGVLSSPSVSKTTVFSVDTDIHPSDRKTMMVDTGIMLTFAQNIGPAIAAGLVGMPSRIPVLGGLFFGSTMADNYIKESPTTPAIENSVVSALVDQVKEMYQGWFTITGIASIKPKDLFYLTDHITDLKGPVFVKDVVHKMDAQTGFITMVSPDAVVLPHDSVIGKQIITGLCQGPLHRLGSFMMMKAVGNGVMQAVKNFRVANRARTLGKAFNAYSKYVNNNPFQTLDTLSAQYPEKFAEMAENTEKLSQKLLQENKAASDAIAASTEAKDLKEVKRLQDEAERIKELTKNAKNLDVDALQELRQLSKTPGPEEVLIDSFFASKEDEFLKAAKLVSKDSKIAAEFAELEKDLVKMEEQLRSANRLIKLEEDALEEAIALEKNRRRAQLAKSLAKELIEVGEIRDEFKIAEEYVERLKNLKNLQGDELAAEVKRLNSLIKEGKILDEALKDGALFSKNERKAIQKLLNLKRVYGEGKLPSATIRGLKSFFRTPKEIITYAKEFKKTAQTAKDVREAIKTARARAIVELGIRGTPYQYLPTGVLKAWMEAQALKKALDAAETTAKAANVGKTAEEVAEAVRVAQAAVRSARAVEAAKLAQEAIAAVRLVKYVGPQVLLSLAVDTTFYMIGSSFIEGHNARLRARQAVKILPLRAHNVPYTAGIKGHQGAVVGDSPSWVDELITESHGVSPGVFTEGMANFVFLVGAMFGAQIPSYGENEVDSAYLDLMRKEEEEQKELDKISGGQNG